MQMQFSAIGVCLCLPSHRPISTDVDRFLARQASRQRGFKSINRVKCDAAQLTKLITVNVRTDRIAQINDRSKDVATFFRILQRHHQAFLDMLKWQVASRSEYERLIKTDPDTLTDLERAARFLYLQKMSFGGKVDGRTFGISTSAPAKFDMTKLVPLLEAAHERLSGVYIECLRWQDFIERWDRPHALFFVDPPYFGVEDYYGKNQFKREEFEELAERLFNLKGRFIVTLNDVPEIRKIFARAKIEPVSLTYTTSGKPTVGKEVIISSQNF